MLPHWFYRMVAASAQRRAEQRLNCRFPSAEAAAARLSPRPWLMIHGERDEYISPAIAQGLFDCGGKSNELWLVPAAKHNRCRETDPAGHAARIVDFLERIAPRRPVPAAAVKAGEALAGEYAAVLAPAALAPPALPREVASSLSR
jgi:hypothetical protein